MAWFSRRPADLIEPGALAQYGRFGFLGPELSGVADHAAAWELLAPLREQLYGDARATQRATAEIRRHAQHGGWEAVGAWRCSMDMVPDADLEAEMTDAALLALASMRIANLALHLGPANRRRFQELTNEPAPNNGFFGPPVFESNFGPTRQYYFDQAIAAAAARTPRRVPCGPGVRPGELEGAARSLSDFGMLVLRGPLLVNPEIRFEPSVVKVAVEAASDVDHEAFCEQMGTLLSEQAREAFNGWAFMGASRFLEDYLDPRLTATAVHVRLVDAGLAQLASSDILGCDITVDVLSRFERERL